MQTTITLHNKDIATFKTEVEQYRDKVYEIEGKLKTQRNKIASIFFKLSDYAIHTIDRDMGVAVFEYSSSHLDNKTFESDREFYNTYMRLVDVLMGVLDDNLKSDRRRNHVRVYVRELDGSIVDTTITDLRLFEGHIHFTSTIKGRHVETKRYVIYWTVNVTIDPCTTMGGCLERMNRTMDDIYSAVTMIQHMLNTLSTAIQSHRAKHTDSVVSILSTKSITSLITKLEHILNQKIETIDDDTRC